MNSQIISSRIREIQKEIFDLRSQGSFSIQEKIQVLKLINVLLREQNQLLAKKQSLSPLAAQ